MGAGFRSTMILSFGRSRCHGPALGSVPMSSLASRRRTSGGQPILSPCTDLLKWCTAVSPRLGLSWIAVGGVVSCWRSSWTRETLVVSVTVGERIGRPGCREEQPAKTARDAGWDHGNHAMPVTGIGAFARGQLYCLLHYVSQAPAAGDACWRPRMLVSPYAARTRAKRRRAWRLGGYLAHGAVLSPPHRGSHWQFACPSWYAVSPGEFCG